MLFAVTWTPRPGSTEALEKRTIALFTNWTPPAGFTFQAFYDYADGDGGVAIVEVNSAETLMEGLAPWGVFFQFSARPLVSSESAVPILQKAFAWRDSVR
jgi:uncharacterized protein DUF3303